MKRKVALVLCVVMILATASVAYAAVGFTNFKMTFTSTTTYQNIVSDTTSKDMLVANDAYARLYVYATTSSVNNVYRTYSGGYVSGQYFKKLTSGTWMYYTSDIDQGDRVYLRGRPDSSVSSCTVTGEFGAG
ncbi:MAG: hypothetical protein GXY67_05980 [Clostridiales bacterium]|nr:hypothetical protein [Clostridiales bacterium]